MTGEEYVEADFREVADNTDPYDRYTATLHEHTGDLTENTLRALTLQLAGAPEQHTDLGTNTHGAINIAVTHTTNTNISHLINVLCDLHPNAATHLNGTNTTATGVLGDTRSGELDPGPLLDPTIAFTAIEQFSALNTDTIDAFAQILDTQTYSFSNSNFRDTVSAPGSILIATEFKYGGLDQYESLIEQLNLPPTITTSVDLTIPTFSNDSASLHTDIEPFSAEFAKAYLAHIRTLDPTLSRDTHVYISEYVTDLKTRVDEFDDLAWEITPTRLTNTLTRLSLAHARLQNNTSTSTSDAKRTIALFERINETLGRDPDQFETTDDFSAEVVTPDSDTSDGYKHRPDTPISEISEELPVLDVYNAIRTLENSYSDGAPIDGVISECSEKNIDEDTVRETIDELRLVGEVYKPKQGTLHST
jgi:DNA replicative helicase MCM subunit Mcm2 (Cdc46/Mcm family)